MGKYVTISEIAQIFSVSPSTVSRALQDHPRISKSLRERIKNKARELGYLPNQYAHVLQQNRTYLIGVIIPDLTLHFYSRILKEIESFYADTPYGLMVCHSNECLDSEVKAVDKLLSKRVDGILAALSSESNQTNHFAKIVTQKVPLVFFDRVDHFLPVPKVLADDYHAAYKATQHLIHTGCKVIAHITASKNLNNSNNRLYGYLDALKDHGIAVRDELICYYKFDQSFIDAFLDKLSTHFPAVDGIFVFNDYVANQVVQRLLNDGKKVPEDVSVIGFSDEPIATYMKPRLSTVAAVARQIGLQASKALLSVIEGETVPEEKIILKQDLVLRETTK